MYHAFLHRCTDGHALNGGVVLIKREVKRPAHNQTSTLTYVLFYQTPFCKIWLIWASAEPKQWKFTGKQTIVPSSPLCQAVDPVSEGIQGYAG